MILIIITSEWVTRYLWMNIIQCINLNNYIRNIKQTLGSHWQVVIIDSDIYINLQGGYEYPDKRVNNLVNFKRNYLEKYWYWVYNCHMITNQCHVSFRMVCMKDIFRLFYFCHDVINNVIFFTSNWNIWKNINF